MITLPLDDLKGKDVIGGRAGGMPEMTFEWALKEHNIDPKKDVNIDTSIAFAAMSRHSLVDKVTLLPYLMIM